MWKSFPAILEFRSVFPCPAVTTKAVSTTLLTPQSVVAVANKKKSLMAWSEHWYYTSKRSIFWVHTTIVGKSL